MAEILRLPTNQTLSQYWSKKYGRDESIILLAYIENMARDLLDANIPFEFDAMVEFRLKDMPKYLPEIERKNIKKTFCSLRDKGILWWIGKIQDCDMLFFTSHEDLLKDFVYFGENSNV